MAQIKFETGQIVDFKGTPTAQDVEEVAQKLGISKKPQSQLDVFQQSKANKDEGVKGVKGFATGFGKSLGQTAVGTGQLLQGLGQRGLAAAIPGMSLEDVRGTSGFETLAGGSEKNTAIKDKLERKGFAEKFGGIAGDVASFAAPAGSITKAGSIASKASKLGKFGSGAIKAGVEGLGYGAIESARQGEVNKSSLGAFAGGAAFSGIGSGVSAFKAGKKASKASFVDDLVMPKETKKIKELALRQGRLQSPTAFGKGKIVPSERDKLLANSIRDVVNPKANTVQNINSIKSKVSDINNGVKKYVASNKTPFNTNQLKSQLNSGKDDLKLVFASDASAEKTYNAVMDAFLNEVKKKDTEGLLLARQSFDQLPAVQKLLKSDKLGENARKEIVLAVRGAANKYVASLLPKGNKYADDLLKEHHMLEALGNISEKGINEIGKNKLQLLAKEYPLLKWFASIGVGAGGVGIGGALINSTD